MTSPDGTASCSRGPSNPEGHHGCGTCHADPAGLGPPVWSHPREALGVILYRPHLYRTLLTALIVGTVLFCINQLNVVATGHATAFVWFKSGLTYGVPFTTSNIGVLVAARRR